MKLEVHQLANKLYEIEIPALDLLNGAEIFIGRSDDCHVVLDDQQISRHHAMLNFRDGQLRLSKLSELGSLSVNGSEVRELALQEGDKFSITDFSVYVRGLPQELPEDDIAPEPDLITQTELEVIPPSDEATAILDSLEESENEDALDLEDDDFEDDHDEESASEAEELFEEEDSQEEEPLNFEDSDAGFPGGSLDSEESAFGENSEDDGFGVADDEGFGSDEGFGDDDGFGGGFGGSSEGDSTQLFQSFAAYYLEIDGESAPFDKYTIEDREIFIGRDPEKCQIVLNDPEVSTVHAVIRKSLINCAIEDLNSSNGTIFNGERVNKAELSNNDNFQIGSTIFTVKIVSQLLESESETLMPVEEGQEVEVEEIVEEEVDYDALVPDGEGYALEQVEEKSFVKRVWKNPKKRMIVIGLGLLVLFLWLSEEETTPKKTPKKKAQTEKVAPEKDSQKKVLPPEVIAKLEENYALALAKYEAGEYYEAKEYLEVIRGIDPDYKDSQTLHKLVKQGHEELLRLKAEEEAEKERKKRQLKIQGMLTKAREAVDKREVAVAESIFGQILEIDPENMDVPQLKLELDAYKEAERRKKEEEAMKKALRQSMVDALQPGKTLYLKEEWYKAIELLERFTKKKGMDEDLIEEATDMLIKSKQNLSAQINPLLGQARSLKEGQDLKRAYETYGDVLKFDPVHEEAITQREEIYDSLKARSMKLYREALISESLSLFDEAREKFQEVQQVSPINSEYYIKATERLKNYLE